MLNKTKIIPIIILLVIMIITAVATILYVQKNNNKIVQNQISTNALNEIPSTNWDTSIVNVVYDTEGVAVPVPIGFVGSEADGENTVNTGFVIYEGDTPVTTSNAYEQSKIRNQWVWIPVPDPSRIYEESGGKKEAKLWSFSDSGRTRLLGNIKEPNVLRFSDTLLHGLYSGISEMRQISFYQELQREFDNTIESIKKYGGFYIGRYETGNLSENKPVIQRYNNDLSTSWYSALIKFKSLSTKNIKVNILWGSLRDETLQWLYETGSKTYKELAVDSTSWGNYYNADFTYPVSADAVITKKALVSMLLPTGVTERNKANNIYDLAGNAEELNMEEVAGQQRGFTGGDCDDRGYEAPVALRREIKYYGQRPWYSSRGVAVRAYFYIK